MSKKGAYSAARPVLLVIQRRGIAVQVNYSPVLQHHVKYLAGDDLAPGSLLHWATLQSPAHVHSAECGKRSREPGPTQAARKVPRRASLPVTAR